MSEAPTPYNSASPTHTKSRKRKEERELDAKREAWAWVMSNPLGRYFVWCVLVEEAGLYKQPFTATSGTDYNCGQLQVALKVRAKLEENFPVETNLMWEERRQADIQSKKQDEAARTVPANGAEATAGL